MSKPRTGHFALWVSVAFATLVMAGVGQAETASALLLERSGATVPEIEPYTEIPSGATISLSPGTRIVFQHYHTCRTVTVVGGEITIGAEAYAVTGGRKERETRTPCPRKVSLEVGGESGGILMRGLAALSLPARPAFVLVGRRARDFSSVRVSRSGSVLLSGSLNGPRFEWPASAAPLVEGAGYELVLVPTPAGGEPFTRKFRVAVPEPAGPTQRLLLIRVD